MNLVLSVFSISFATLVLEMTFDSQCKKISEENVLIKVFNQNGYLQNSENQFDRERGEDQEPQSSLVQKQRMHRFPEAQAPVFQPALYPAYQPVRL